MGIRTGTAGMTLAVLLAGCNDFEPHIRTTPSAGDYTIATSAALRSGIVLQHAGRGWV